MNTSMDLKIVLNTLRMFKSHAITLIARFATVR